MFAGVVIFSLFAVLVSCLIFKRYEKIERAELSTYVVLIAWGSLLWGLFLSR